MLPLLTVMWRWNCAARGSRGGGWRFGQGAVVRSEGICRLLDGTSRCSKEPSTGFVVTDSCDMVAAVGVSEGDARGWVGRWGSIARPGNECLCLQGVGSRLGAGGKVFTAVVDVVGSVDGGSVGVIRGDTAVSRGVLGCVSRGAVCVPASTVVVASVWALESFRAVILASFDAIAFATSVTSIRWPSSIDTQWP